MLQLTASSSACPRTIGPLLTNGYGPLGIGAVNQRVASELTVLELCCHAGVRMAKDAS